MFADTIKIHHATRAKAERLTDMLQAEYPALSLRHELNEDASRVTGWMVVATADDTETTIYEGDKLPDIADLLDACDEHGIDPEAGAEEERKPSGTVVAEHYRTQYREASSNKQTCGDWLAERLVADTHGPEGFMVDDFTNILNANGVDMSAKWAQLPYSGQKGWIGRYRMNGRQVLEKTVALTGVYRDHQGNEVEPEAGFLAAMRTKHAKWIAKQEKLAALAEETAS